MNKKTLTLLLILGLVASLVGCSKKEAVDSTLENVEEFPEVSEEAEEETEEEIEEKTEETSAKRSEAVLGGDEEYFDEFEYLYPEELKTESAKNEESGKMESKSITVMIPLDDYASVNRDYAYVDTLGVYFKVSLNPYLQYNQKDYLMGENLQAYLDDEFDEFYTTDLKDVEISEITEPDDTRAYANASYVEYDKWDDMYIPYYNFFYVKEIEKDLTVLVEIEINLSEVTGKTPKLLEEIESFYEIEIGWDKETMEKKVADFVANDNGETDKFSTGYLIFELPKGWDEDYDFDDDYSSYSYAPGGDGMRAECAVSVEREYSYDDDYDVEEFLKDPDATKALFAEQFGDTASNIDLEDLGETALGKTAKMIMDVTEDGTTYHYAFYFASSKNYVYTIYAVQSDQATDDAFAAADMLIETAQVKK